MSTITIEEGLVYYLSHTAGITALVSTRVYGNRIPQGATLPCIVITRISTPRILTHDTVGSAGTASPRFQIDAWGDLDGTVKPITDAVRAALNGFKGAMGSGNTVNVQVAYVDEERPQYDGETNLWRSQSDYIIWHEEA
jgi:hypothetical protein